MEDHLCQRCGGPLQLVGREYHCPYCRAVYRDEVADAAFAAVGEMLDATKRERLSAARRVLYDAVHEPNPSHAKVGAAAREVLALYPNDNLARFYELSTQGDPAPLNDFLVNARLPLCDAEDVVRWMRLGLESRNVAPTLTFVEAHFAGEQLEKYQGQIQDEAERLDQGVYSTLVPRDVFLAYSSADTERAAKIVDELESNGFTVFAAFRNLRHGRGAAENYLKSLYEAMEHCKCVVFLSSKSSRTIDCDAFDVELPYIQKNLPKMGRIEYVLDSYQDAPPVKAVELTLKEFFVGLTWCTRMDDLIVRINKYRHGTKTKLCPNCKTTLDANATMCPHCGHKLGKKKTGLILGLSIAAVAALALGIIIPTVASSGHGSGGSSSSSAAVVNEFETIATVSVGGAQTTYSAASQAFSVYVPYALEYKDSAKKFKSLTMVVEYQVASYENDHRLDSQTIYAYQADIHDPLGITQFIDDFGGKADTDIGIYAQDIFEHANFVQQFETSSEADVSLDIVFREIVYTLTDGSSGSIDEYIAVSGTTWMNAATLP